MYEEANAVEHDAIVEDYSNHCIHVTLAQSAFGHVIVNEGNQHPPLHF